MVGTGQCGGKDRRGITALMQSLAQMDPTGILCGPNVCNMLVEPSMVKDDQQFEKLCRMIETYFKLGGIHVQLNYVSPEELRKAQQDPENYRSLRVRVSGYSTSFVTLSEAHQTEIIARTVKGL
jgi:formate C-acetyltransferase